MTKLTKVEGIGHIYAQKLREAGVQTAKSLLQKGASPAGRKEIAEKTGISDKLILEWVNHVDLFRIRGVSEEYADLLEEGGVDTVPELAQRNAENLYGKLLAVNQEKKLVRRLPSQAAVRDWIEQAKQLPRVITY
jgi:predicted flap endonuclease-1-like 5' DNA nuclease